MFSYLKKIFILISTILVSINSLSADLASIYFLAEKNDPTYQQEISKHRAVTESRPQALAKLLPSLNLSGNTKRNAQDITTSGSSVGADGEIDFNSHGYSLSITQPLFRRDDFIALAQADSQIKESEAKLAKAQQNLIIKVSKSYFNVLKSLDNLEFAKTEVTSLKRQLDQANQKFEVGLSAITDVQEAKAGYDLAVAQEIQAINKIDNAKEEVRELTGEYIDQFSVLGKDILLVKPNPEVIDSWTELAIKQNLDIAAANFALESARKEIKKQSAGHLPTVDIVASHGYDSTGGRFGSTRTDRSAIGLELNIPIYSGGLVNSKTREAHEKYNQSMHYLEKARRSAQRETREAYLGVISGISQVAALKQAVISSETALLATESGFEVGTRTAVDVVASQRATSKALRDYSNAKYDYILNTLKLKRSAGTLSPDDLNLINAWLIKK
jgi:outer membrane protein|tara:strand:- start:612 stop:1943 length:1332 start_codon:yes stop_codon:yes gene_type:complete